MEPAWTAACSYTPSFVPYIASVAITVDGAMVVGNHAGSRSRLASGGGLYLVVGGMLAVVNSTFSWNTASLFGGGLALGSEDTSTCGVQLLAGSAFLDNSATHGGGQVYSTCNGNVVVDGATFLLNTQESQARETCPPLQGCSRSSWVDISDVKR